MYTKKLREISEYLPDENIFIVYGAGWTGYKFQYLLKILDREIKYFIDDTIEDIKDGKIISSLENTINREKDISDFTILIATPSKKGIKIISEKLKQYASKVVSFDEHFFELLDSIDLFEVHRYIEKYLHHFESNDFKDAIKNGYLLNKCSYKYKLLEHKIMKL